MMTETDKENKKEPIDCKDCKWWINEECKIPKQEDCPNYELPYRFKIRLSELRAEHIGAEVDIECQITGEQTQKAIPEQIVVRCETCGQAKLFNAIDLPELLSGERPIKIILNELKAKLFCPCEKPYKVVEVKDHVDLAILYVRDLLRKDDIKFTDRQFKNLKVYTIKSEIPKTNKIRIIGKVILEEKSKNLSISVTEIYPLENQFENFKITGEDKENFQKYFCEKEDCWKQINPDIVGEVRDYAKQSVSLQLHSPARIYDIERKRILRGGMNIVFYGDTKVGKSEIAKAVTNKGSIPLGEYVPIETGSRTGLLYAIDNDNKTLIFGALPLNDMGLVALDGLQSMHSDEMGEFRESIENQEVNVNRSIRGGALARTRILACLNPNKPMNQYIYRCQAIPDNYVFSKTPELTRYDLYIPFCKGDVSAKEINEREFVNPIVPNEIYIKHVYWVWSRSHEDIIYTESAVKKIKELSSELIDNYSIETLPIVHNGIREVLTRLSVAKACECHSTDENHEKVIVESEHVTKVVDWYRELLDLLELSKYKAEIEGKTELTDNECIAIAKDLGETEYRILELIKLRGQSSSILAEELGIVSKTVKEHYKPLQKYGLVETMTGVGIALSVKGVKFVRWAISNPSNMGTNNVTNKKDSNTKGYYVTNSNEQEEEKFDGLEERYK